MRACAAASMGDAAASACCAGTTHADWHEPILFPLCCLTPRPGQIMYLLQVVAMMVDVKRMQLQAQARPRQQQGPAGEGGGAAAAAESKKGK